MYVVPEGGLWLRNAWTWLGELAAEVRHNVQGLLLPNAALCQICGCVLAPSLLPFPTPLGDVRGVLCPECMARVVWVLPPLCERCGRPWRDRELCRFCREGFSTVQGRSAAVHAGCVRTLLIDLKFRNSQRVATALGYLAGAAALELMDGWRATAVIPVPLHRERLLERGYNQAELLAAGVARVLRLPVWPGTLERTRATVPQSSLRLRERLGNVRGAFSVSVPGQVEGRRFLLVDDVHTTGATLSAAAKALFAAGAAGVRFSTVTVAVSPSDTAVPAIQRPFSTSEAACTHIQPGHLEIGQWYTSERISSRRKRSVFAQGGTSIACAHA